MERTQAQNGTVMDQLLGPFLETPSSNYSRHSQNHSLWKTESGKKKSLGLFKNIIKL
jgi:hypothetical protein